MSVKKPKYVIRIWVFFRRPKAEGVGKKLFSVLLGQGPVAEGPYLRRVKARNFV